MHNSRVSFMFAIIYLLSKRIKGYWDHLTYHVDRNPFSDSFRIMSKKTSNLHSIAIVGQIKICTSFVNNNL